MVHSVIHLSTSRPVAVATDSSGKPAGYEGIPLPQREVGDFRVAQLMPLVCH
jgi:hypothetical protein